MSRRAFVALLAAPTIATAQPQRGRPWRIAFEDTISTRSKHPAELGFAPFDVEEWFAREGLAEGRDIVFEPMHLHEVISRGGDFRPRVRDIVASRPDVMLVVGAGGPVPVFLKRTTSEIPVVFFSLGVDPVRIGLVKSLREPGGNITGTTWPPPDVMASKEWGILKELRPAARRIGVLMSRQPGDVWIESMRAAQEAAAARLNLERVEIHVAWDKEFAPVASAIRAARVDLLDPESGPEWVWRPELIRYVRNAGIVTLWQEVFVRQGGLVAVSASIEEMAHEAVRMVARILRGARPADIPIYQARRFDVSLNLATARAMKLEVSAALRLQATRLVE